MDGEFAAGKPTDRQCWGLPHNEWNPHPLLPYMEAALAMKIVLVELLFELIGDELKTRYLASRQSNETVHLAIALAPPK
jgi:hypothetical protein